MKFNPYPYQSAAIDWVMTHPYCGLLLDMGLGKSVITLTAISQLIDSLDIRRALVIAPARVAETTWTTEAAKWDHLRHLKVVALTGEKYQRKRLLEEADADVYVISRDLLKWLGEYYGIDWPFDMVVLDELTSFKNPQSARFKIFKQVRPNLRRVVGLTGTPAPNGMEDLWAQMYCLDMGARLGKYVTRYRDTYFNLRRWNNIVIKSTPKPGSVDAIRAKIADICISMSAADYLTLPPARVIDVPVLLPPFALKLCKDFERDNILPLVRDADSGVITAAGAGALMNKLAQMSNGAVYADDGNVEEIHDAKLGALAELADMATGPLLVFYTYRHDVPRIRTALRYRGNGRTATAERRVAVYEGPETLKAWNAGEIDVLLAHPASTAYGLNMQAGGNVIVWFGLTWDLELYQQANARLHRQGQERPVMIYRLIGQGTVDERAAKALDGKATEQSGLIAALKAMVEEWRKVKVKR